MDLSPALRAQGKKHSIISHFHVYELYIFFPPTL